MIYTLTLNPSIDYYVTLPEVVLGEVNRIQETTQRAGGKGGRWQPGYQRSQRGQAGTALQNSTTTGHDVAPLTVTEWL